MLPVLTTTQAKEPTLLIDIKKTAAEPVTRVTKLDITANKNVDGYIFYVDPETGDLSIALNERQIGSYCLETGKWILETEETAKISTIEGVLQNHYQAILAICEKLDMV